MKRQTGFTLIELIVVVAIIGVLTGIGVPTFQKYQERSRMSEGNMALSNWHTAAGAYLADAPGQYADLVTATSEDLGINMTGGYFSSGLHASANVMATKQVGCSAPVSASFGGVDGVNSQYYIAAAGNVQKGIVCEILINAEKTKLQTSCPIPDVNDLPAPAITITYGNCNP